ncbi:MAG TPA: WD40 repeat domain-containing protein, partial [Kofleriaceae bacterium]|nr:WD40 repeat domain-containing protein [Kofleriaceae bacterium]
PEAIAHLAEAYKRDRSPSTAFMYARALQPRLAEQARFTSTLGRMWSATYSPNGRQIVTTDDGGAQIRDAQTYRALFALPHGAEVYHAIYSVDGAKLVTAAKDAVRVWDSTSGTLVQTLENNDGRKDPNYYIAAMSFDGRLIAAIDGAGAVTQVWDGITGAAVAQLHSEAAAFPSLAFSSDGRWLATTGGNDVRVFDTRTWRSALVLPGPRIHKLVFAPAGSRLVTGAATGDVSIWSIPSGTRVQHLREIGESVDALAFSADGELVVAGSGDGALQIWRSHSGAIQSQLNPRRSRVLAVEFDRTAKLVLSASADGTVTVADASLGISLTVLDGPQSAVRVAHFDPSSQHVIGASKDGTARVWDSASPYLRWNSPPVAVDCGMRMPVVPDGRFIAVSCAGHATSVWDTSKDQLLAELPSTSSRGIDSSDVSAVSNDGTRAAVAHGTTVDVYELPGGRLLRSIEHLAPVNALAFASTGGDIASGAVDGSLVLTRSNGESLRLPGLAGAIDAVAFLPDRRLVAADARRQLRIYRLDGAVLAELDMPGRVASLRIDGTRLVTVPIAPVSSPVPNAPVSSPVGPPLLVDLESYRIVARLDGHIGRVFSARWVSGHRIVTAGGDGTVRLWDGSTGQLRQTYRGGPRYLTDATLAANGFVLAGGADGQLWFWDQETARLLWTLPVHKSQLTGVHVEGEDIVTRGFTGELSRWRLPKPEQVIGACGDQERCAILAR